MKNAMSIKRIPVSKLRLGMYIHRLGGNWFQHPFWRGNFLLDDAADLRIIQRCGIPDVWIVVDKNEPGSRPATEIGWMLSPSGAGADDGLSAAPAVTLAEEVEHARRLCLGAQDQILSMFDEARMGKAINAHSAVPLVQQIADSVERHPQALLSVARLKTQDNYTYLHSVAVCALMLALARQLRLDYRLTQLAGLGGLMHDLGKAAIPLDILNKPGKLTDAEFEAMKRHPARGAAMLREGGADPAVQAVAMHHHEKINGKGYPDGLAADAIPLLARMGAVCDVYDAVTSVRPYKDPWNPAEAMRQMARWEGHFDRPIFEAFVKAVGIYPVGSLVRLKSQRLAVVTDVGPDTLLTPCVTAFYSAQARAPVPEEPLDLSDPGCGDSILGPEDPELWQLQGLDAYWLPGA